MLLDLRLRAAGRAALIHFGVSLVVAAAAAFLVFQVWYPYPYREVSGGRGLFLILILVDLVCGPVLTLVLFDPKKSRLKWRVDVALIVIVQVGALLYGLHQVSIARPVFLAFEGDRFRVVHASDVDRHRLSEAPQGFVPFRWTGPELIGTRLAKPTDSDFPQSVQLSLQGLPPAFRPGRWQLYRTQSASVLSAAKPFAELKVKHPTRLDDLRSFVAKSGKTESHLGYVPLVRDEITDWVVIVDLSNADPVGFLHLDGW